MKERKECHTINKKKVTLLTSEALGQSNMSVSYVRTPGTTGVCV